MLYWKCLWLLKMLSSLLSLNFSNAQNSFSFYLFAKLLHIICIITFCKVCRSAVDIAFASGSFCSPLVIAQREQFRINALNPPISCSLCYKFWGYYLETFRPFSSPIPFDPIFWKLKFKRTSKLSDEFPVETSEMTSSGIPWSSSVAAADKRE